VFDYAVDVIRSRMASLGIGEQSTSDFEQQIVQLRDYWSVYAPSAWEYSFGEEKGNHEAASVPALMRKRREKMSEVHGDNSNHGYDFNEKRRWTNSTANSKSICIPGGRQLMGIEHEIRQATVIQGNGPGSLTVLQEGLSVIIPGLDAWYRKQTTASDNSNGIPNMRSIQECA